MDLTDFPPQPPNPPQQSYYAPTPFEMIAQQAYHGHAHEWATRQEWYAAQKKRLEERHKTPVVAIDIEATGFAPEGDHLIPSLSVTVYDPNKPKSEQWTTVFETLGVPYFPESFTKPDGSLISIPHWEDDCIKWWAKLPKATLDILRSPYSGTDPEHADSPVLYQNYERDLIPALHKIRDAIENCSEEPIIVGDFHAFDAGIISQLLRKYHIGYSREQANGPDIGKPVWYSKKFGFLSLRDVNDMADLFPKQLISKLHDVCGQGQFKNDHDPRNDSKNMIFKWLCALDLMESLLPFNEVITQHAIQLGTKRKFKEQRDQETKLGTIDPGSEKKERSDAADEDVSMKPEHGSATKICDTVVAAVVTDVLEAVVVQTVEGDSAAAASTSEVVGPTQAE